MANLGRIAIVPKGNFNIEIAYKKLDLISYEGGSYIAVEDTLKGESPTTSPIKWLQSGSKGDAGKDGVTTVVGGVPDAPKDNKVYARKDESWKEIEDTSEIINQLKYNINNSALRFGGFNGSPSSGAEVSNTLRLKSIDIINVIDGVGRIVVISKFGIEYQLSKGYKDGVFVPNAIPLDSSGVINVDTAIFNGIRIALKKSDNSIITQEELDDVKVFYYTDDFTGYNLLQERLTEVEKKIPEPDIIISPWFGKKFTVLGDSISYGLIPANSPNAGTQTDSYAKITADRLGMVLDNKGIAGSVLGTIEIGSNTRSPFVYRYNQISDEQDLIVVMGGANDIRFINNLGTFEDTDETSFYGALHVLCLGLLDKFRINQGDVEGAKKHIVLCTPIRMLSRDLTPYCEAIKEIGKYYSIPVWDAFNLSGITPHILRTIQGTESIYTDMYNPYITDGTHPTSEGHKIMANSFMGFLNTIN